MRLEAKMNETFTEHYTIFNPQFTLGHFFALGPLTSPNLNIVAIWVRDPWVSI